MVNPYALAAGIVIGTFVVVKFRKTKWEKRPWVYPLLLATFPIYYWVFAVHGADYAALQNELIAGVLFISLAYGAFKLDGFGALLLLAIVYIAHAIYDAAHNTLFVNSGAPLWWPEFCGSIDAVIGVYLLVMAATLKTAERKIA
jgi:hypothetical protein